jgi:hypothetical protein
MNLELAIEQILDMQARAEERMDRTDRQIAGIRTLMRTGMKLIVRIEKAQQRSDVKLAELADAQLKPERKFDKLVDLWRQHPPNVRR